MGAWGVVFLEVVDQLLKVDGLVPRPWGKLPVLPGASAFEGGFRDASVPGTESGGAGHRCVCLWRRWHCFACPESMRQGPEAVFMPAESFGFGDAGIEVIVILLVCSGRLE